jgi:GyrI-like small molecule binding domain
VTYEIEVDSVEPELIAAVRVQVNPGEVGRAWRAALDQVWAVLRSRPGLARGHNLFLYHHPARPGQPMAVDFGVQVFGALAPVGAVRTVQVPAGEVVRTVHQGPIDQLAAAHEAIHAWCATNGRQIGSASWETYGDPVGDAGSFDVQVTYLVA